jgi:rsbT antagonist protein RsbS
MERIPILQMGDFLLVTIQVDMHDQLALTLQDDLSGRMIGMISGLSRIMDAETVLVGMQPAVAITLVELGMTLPGVSTALNVERGMKLLRERASSQ